MNRVLWSVAVVALACPVVARADEDAEFKRLAAFTSAETVFVGKPTKVTKGPVGLSNPPVHTFKFEFGKGSLLRGTIPGNREFNYSIRVAGAPGFDTDSTYIVGINGTGVVAIVPGDKDDIERVKKLTSPWAAVGDKAWPKDGPFFIGERCAKTGRPALLCGNSVEWKVEQVPAKNPMKFRNDMFGDGTFKVTLTNTTKGPATVAALLTDGKGGILWADCVLVKTGGKTQALPGGGKVTKDSTQLVLKAGESVTAELTVLPLPDVEWPRGGQRVYFDFLLGEKSANNFFYYFSAVHDPMRDEAIKAAGGK
jgi:hypothetical protein